MGKLADRARGYTAGGVTLHSSSNPFKGELRFSTDKSLVYPNALFVSCEVLTEEGFTSELLDKIAARFAEVAKDVGLEFTLVE